MQRQHALFSFHHMLERAAFALEISSSSFIHAAPPGSASILYIQAAVQATVQLQQH
jgi:hypothetical protein